MFMQNNYFSGGVESRCGSQIYKNIGYIFYNKYICLLLGVGATLYHIVPE